MSSNSVCPHEGKKERKKERKVTGPLTIPIGYPPAHYFEPTLNQIPPHGYPAAPQYYQAHAAPQPSATAYGNVYYALGNDTGSAYESKKRGYDALNEFFGDLKRRQFNPTSYADVGHRLLGLQSLQLPVAASAPAPEYQPMPAVAAVAATAGGGGGVGGYHPAPAPVYQLPPMSNIRTKNDLLNIDRFLEQMQNTIYENDDHVAAAGVAQPGAHYAPSGGMHYRNSPPTQLPPTHAMATAAPTFPRAASMTHSPTASATPALTPPSSSQSNTSGLSPRSSLQTGHRLSPPQQQQHDSTSAMYPRLPAATMAEIMPAYAAVSGGGGATTSTLSSALDDDRRRYTGGTLQRARPGGGGVQQSPMESATSSPDGGKDETENTSSGSTVRQSESPALSSSLIDPALNANGTPSPDRETAQRTAQAATAVADGADIQWVEKVRLIEYMRDYIGSRLQRGEFDEEQPQSPAGEQRDDDKSSPEEEEEGEEEGQDDGEDRMEGIERSEPVKPVVEEAVKNNLYPVLHVMDEDGDCPVEDAV